jgi:hypothetical protein
MNRILRNSGEWYRRNGATGSNVAKIPVPPLWTPSAITTAMWLDAADSTTITIATGVSQWNDKSGNARNATQANSANQPAVISGALNGKNVIRFDGSNDFLDFNGSFFASTSYSIYAVITRRTSSTTYWLGGSGSNTNENLILGFGNNTTATYAQYLNDLTGTVAGYTVPVADLFGYVLNTSVGRILYRNGAVLNSNGTTTALTSFAGSRLGNFSTGSIWYNGDLSEVVATTSILSTSDGQKMEGYLAWKWGLVSSLPNDHPYKNAAPTL